MTSADTITAIKKDLEAEIERVVQSVNEWDDRTSPDDYPEHLLITSEELADILRNFADVTLESLQRENQSLRVDASNHAADAETVRRERDALLAENSLKPFGWTSKHVNDGEQHRLWGRNRENVAGYKGVIVQRLYVASDEQEDGE